MQLDPMPAYERKVIHSELADNSKVKTYSRVLNRDDTWSSSRQDQEDNQNKVDLGKRGKMLKHKPSHLEDELCLQFIRRRSCIIVFIQSY